MAELSDEELRVLQGSKKLLDQMLTPKHRRKTQAIIKELYPDQVVTEDDIAAPYVERLDKLDEKLSKFIDGEKGKKLDDRLERDIAYLRKERDFTDEGIEKLKKLMVEKEIPDIVVAADHWERQNPPKSQEPSILAPTDWGFGRKSEDKDWNELFQDEDAWAEKEARRAWSEETAKKGQIVT